MPDKESAPGSASRLVDQALPLLRISATALETWEHGFVKGSKQQRELRLANDKLSLGELVDKVRSYGELSTQDVADLLELAKAKQELADPGSRSEETMRRLENVAARSIAKLKSRLP